MHEQISKQKNPVLSLIKSVPWEFGDTVSDYQINQTTGSLFLSLKYHKLHPDYLDTRLQKFNKSYDLKILLCLCDVQDHELVLKEITKSSVINNLTLIVGWSDSDIARYIQLFKSFERRPPDLIKEKIEDDYVSKLTNVLTTIRGVNKTDVLTLATNFGLEENASLESLQALERLANLPAPTIDLKALPARGVAAVLVLLHLTPTGGLAVTLTTRSARLKSHPGETALPGGRVDLTDESVIAAALREANEEIGLPIQDLTQYGYLATLDAFLSRHLLIVYPVVYVYLDAAEGLLSKLKASPDEVSNIFHLELNQIFESYLKGGSGGNQGDDEDGKMALNYSFQDITWIKGTHYRYHKLQNPNLIPTPLSGLTADILLSLTGCCFGSQVTPCERFVEIRAPGQADWKTLIGWVLTDHAEKR